MEGVSYSRLAPAADQARAAAGYLAGQYADRNVLIVGAQAVLDDLVFDPEHTDEFEDAMERLAADLGFTAQRPERDTNNGPDVLWSTGSLNYLVIECKSGATTNRIWRHDAAQLAHSMSWFTEHYDQTCRATPLMIHPATILAADATTPPRARIITADRLDRLRAAVRAMVIALGDAGTWRDPDAVAAQLTQNKLTGTALLNAYTADPRRQ